MLKRITGLNEEMKSSITLIDKDLPILYHFKWEITENVYATLILFLQPH